MLPSRYHAYYNRDNTLSHLWHRQNPEQIKFGIRDLTAIAGHKTTAAADCWRQRVRGRWRSNSPIPTVARCPCRGDTRGCVWWCCSPPSSTYTTVVLRVSGKIRWFWILRWVGMQHASEQSQKQILALSHEQDYDGRPYIRYCMWKTQISTRVAAIDLGLLQHSCFRKNIPFSRALVDPHPSFSSRLRPSWDAPISLWNFIETLILNK